VPYNKTAGFVRKYPKSASPEGVANATNFGTTNLVGSPGTFHYSGVPSTLRASDLKNFVAYPISRLTNASGNIRGLGCHSRSHA
jgi:hypothetical protein